jgi:hypothetical protein
MPSTEYYHLSARPRLNMFSISSTHRRLRLHAVAWRARPHWHVQRARLRQIWSVGQRYGRRRWRTYGPASASASSWSSHSLSVAVVRVKVVVAFVRATMGGSCSSKLNVRKRERREFGLAVVSG